DGAEGEVVVRVAQQLAGFSRKPVRLFGGPEQYVGVQQIFHGFVPNRRAISPSPIRSKSFGTFMPVDMKPRRRALPGTGASRATTLTSGLPALEMTKGSPRAASATSFERWVLASWMFMEFLA